MPKLAYRTDIQTVRQKNNVTLTTLQIMANGLQVSFAGLLAGGKKVPEWAHRLDDNAIRKRLAHITQLLLCSSLPNSLEFKCVSTRPLRWQPAP
ncbi:hypothetical protein [Mesorhizobium sp. 131-2-5]|uniref:hypothetical protein n=1 Tax=Mesorhizobium sp. 131-2-5 TaxID=2744519 RepID=UPI001FD312DB|nr:hypothetical protein [Mesorhizobium sp. 131-2-5]